jgi:hypothetical protein
VPAGEELVFTQIVALQRNDGGCLTEADLEKLVAGFLDAYNTEKTSLYDTCDSNYRQLTAVTSDPSLLGGCQRRRKVVEEETENDRFSRSLQSASVNFEITVRCTSETTCLLGGCLDTKVKIIADWTSLGYINIVFDLIVTNGPSATPTSYPSDFPSESPSTSLPPPSIAPNVAPSSLPSASPSSTPSHLISAPPTVSASPSRNPTLPPTGQPSSSPSVAPSSLPSASPSSKPSHLISAPPTLSASPSAGPTVPPTGQLSSPPSVAPSGLPSAPPVDG